MRLAAILPFFFAGLGLVRAIDERLLYTIPAGDTIDTFTSDFESTCATWAPAIAAGLTSEASLVEPGDFSGANADTEARIYCTWTHGTTIVPFTTEVAASLGATEA
ncbi:hypothetical protein DFH07DRAFT_948328 [Mycena maculata]|uniref:Uncharacterized protein n=1 Tax=Mycena maculata TaxID=230809 RepID=A0AAD7KIB7_9AGAR|nr:hypothetical protein DFH07DRAFT_948328 [Mycena maculata]